jgi:hypothetical protein
MYGAALWAPALLLDDLQRITLPNDAMNAAVELWPNVEHRAELPEDVLSVIKGLEE